MLPSTCFHCGFLCDYCLGACMREGRVALAFWHCSSCGMRTVQSETTFPPEPPQSELDQVRSGGVADDELGHVEPRGRHRSLALLDRLFRRRRAFSTTSRATPPSNIQVKHPPLLSPMVLETMGSADNASIANG